MITTHVLDTSLGQPASGLSVVLAVQTSTGVWTPLGKGRTNADGRVSNLLSTDHALVAQVYRLTFGVAGYFRSMGRTTFYPEVSIVFQVVDPTQHYHVPLLLSPFGYSTYRGS
jgi:5-hydroxyisourate hydrolase